MKRTTIIILVSMIEICHSARILGVFPLPSYSHQQVFRAVMLELAKNGHEIVMMTPNPENSTATEYKNITEIDVQKGSDEIWRRQFNLSSFTENNYFVPYKLYHMYKYTLLELFDQQLSTPEMKDLLRNPNEHFDLIIVESLAVLFFPLASHFKAPVIGICSTIGSPTNYEILGSPSNLFVYPVITLFSSTLDFLTKLKILSLLLYALYLDWGLFDTENALLKKHLGQDVPTWQEAERQMSSFFPTLNPVLQYVRPTVPKIINLGGVQLKLSPNMTEELTKYLDEAKEGIIYVSLGTNILHLPAPQLRIFQEVFTDLPYKIVWKWGNETRDVTHKNIYMSSFLPQRSILAHPNLKAFVTLAGLHSLEEAIYNKVPLVALPVVNDQIDNAHKITAWRIGITLDFWSINKTIFRKAILDVARNETFRVNIQKMSQIVNDEKSTGLERAIWWTEYVLRHRGAGYLQAPILPLHEYLLLDVIALFVTVITSIILILFSCSKIKRII